LADPDDPKEFTLTCLREDRAVPFELHATTAVLFVDHRVRVIDDHCETLSYSYRLQHGARRQAWIVRWEYLRQPPDSDYSYPLGHLHVNASFETLEAAALTTKPLSRLHLATGRQPLPPRLRALAQARPDSQRRAPRAAHMSITTARLLSRPAP
jgi:hypothetical protein